LGKLVKNSAELRNFIKNFTYFHKRYIVEKIVIFGYYLQKKEGYDCFSVEDIDECFSATSSPPPKNFNDLFLKLAAVNKIIKHNDCWKLSGLEEENIDQNELGGLPLVTIKDELKTLLGQLPAEQQKFGNEIIGCLQVQVWRGAIVLTWILTMAHLQKIVLNDFLEKFNEILGETKLYKDLTVSKIEDFEEIKDNDLLRTIRTCGIVSGSQFGILETRLKERNRYAHPTNLEITDTIALAFIEDLVNNILLKVNLGEK